MTVVSFQAASGLDFAAELGGVIYTNGIFFRSNAVGEWITVFVDGVTIPAGATINSATLNVYLGHPAMLEPYHTIDAEDAASPSRPASGDANNSISGRTGTTNSVVWGDGTSLPSTGFYDTPDLSLIIQELVDNYDYSSGSPMLFRFVYFGTGGDIGIYTPVDDPSEIATLTIDYTSGGGGGTTIIVADIVSGTDGLDNIGVLFSLSDAESGQDALSPGDISSLATIVDASFTISTLSALATLTIDDAIVGEDSSALQLYVTLSDTTIGADFLASLSIFADVISASSSADTIAVSTIVDVSDVQSAMEAVSSLSATMSILDALSGLDTPSAQLLITVADASTLTDTFSQLAVMVSQQDVMGGNLALSVTASVPVTDLQSAVDGVVVSIGEIFVAITDGIFGTDAISSLGAIVSVSELEQVTDTPVLNVNLSLVDGTIGTAAVNILTGIIKTISETSSSVSGLGISAGVNAADLSSSTMLPAIAVDIEVGDALAAAVSNVSVSQIVNKLVSDLAAMTDSLNLPSIIASVVDGVSGVDGLNIGVSLSISDDGHGIITLGVDDGRDIYLKITISGNPRDIDITGQSRIQVVGSNRRIIIQPSIRSGHH